ncbi:hypothetical protein [Gordonia sihwensis]|uniref:hypothetical protein n=1 Tax=Gordonia sihwensis TaxID=173559 RepID=UPI003D959C6F
MTAVRFVGERVSYGDLSASLRAYRVVTDEQGMSLESALHAALIHRLPALVSLDSTAMSRSIEQIIQWLSRHLSEATANGGLTEAI